MNLFVVGSLSASHSEIMINGEELTFTVTVKDQTECQNEPNNWEITGKNPKPEMKYLLVFHLLPQSSGRIIGQAEEDVDCNLELEITFVSLNSFYSTTFPIFFFPFLE